MCLEMEFTTSYQGLQWIADLSVPRVEEPLSVPCTYQVNYVWQWEIICLCTAQLAYEFANAKSGAATKLLSNSCIQLTAWPHYLYPWTTG